MAAPVSKKMDSCSPVPSRPTNPNSRNSEISNPMRRSFCGSPFSKPSIIANPRGGFNHNTPVNSPSDYSRRNSIGRENIVVTLRDQEDKENGKDQSWKAARVRSPAKGTKNFMSPTISAASKINASPRKKILVERNEQIRSSISFSDPKSPLTEDLNSKHEKGLNQKKEVSFDSTVTYLEDNESLQSDEHVDSVLDSSTNDDFGLSSENPTAERDCVNLDPSFKISPRVSCSLPSPALAPLDADPSMPPYDPKTNYLSPRPQFLHYRPNPRIELYLNKERDGQPLEEIFASESVLDAEVSEEETQSDDSEKESGDASSGDVEKEEKDAIEEELLVSEPEPIKPSVGQAEVKEEEEDVVDKEELLVSEPNPIKTSVGQAEVKEEEYEVVDKEELLVSEPNPIKTSVGQAEVKEEEGEVVDKEELLVSEPNPVKTSVGQAEVKRVSKSNFFTRTKLITLLLILAIGCLCVSFTNSPIIDPSVLNNLGFSEVYVPSELSEFARNSFKNLAQKFQIWIHRSLRYAYDLITSFRDRQELGPLQYANLTTLFEDGFVDGHLVFDQSILGATVKHEDNMVEPIREAEIDIKIVEEEKNVSEPTREAELGIIKLVEEDSQPSTVDKNMEEIVGENNNHDFYGRVSNSEDVSYPEAEEVHMPLQSDVVKPGSSAQQGKSEMMNQPDNSGQEASQEFVETVANNFDLQSSAHLEDLPVPQAAEIQPEIFTSRQHQGIDDIVLPIAKNDHEILAGAARENPRSSESAIVLSARMMVGISLTVLCLLGTAFIHTKIRTPTTPNAKVDQVPMTKKLDYGPTSVAAEHAFQERRSSRNWQTEVDLVGESCPSETSSFQESLSYRKKGQKGTGEAQSHDRRPSKNYRRESMASSDYSMGSPSYGSFTTYEKIPSKLHGNDEEVITPVRRSSRIRNQVTSP